MAKTKRANKYNAKKVTIDGITFDSIDESKYYKYLKKLKAEGRINDFTLQPKYELQPKFTNRRGKNILPIHYKADFLVTFPDGTQQVIDVKGMETADFKLKKKMFEYKYDQSLILVCKAPKYLAPREWIELEELKQIRKERKKMEGK